MDGCRRRLVLVEDASELISLQNRLIQLQKMECLGRLVGGVSHDFNNLLTAILGYAELTEESMSATDEVRRYMGNIVGATERASQLTRQLTSFTKFQSPEPKALALNSLIADVYRVLRKLTTEDIEITLTYGTNLYPVLADEGQVQQVLINLVSNAQDAIPAEGRIAICTANRVFNAAEIVENVEVAAGEYVEITVSDTGTGFTANALKHLFEPFYSTKSIGKGTGLGLVTCRDIATRYGGYMYVASSPGNGAQVGILMPRAKETERIVDTTSAGISAVNGSETILFVEDEPLVRDIAEQTLRSYGYRVLAVANGPEALQIASEQTDRIDIVVTDIVMPQMEGTQLAAQLRESRRDIKVLYTTGYGQSTLDRLGANLPQTSVFAKPYTPIALAGKIREILGSAS